MDNEPDNTRYEIVSGRYSIERERADNLNSRAVQAVGISGTLMALLLGLGNTTLANVQKTNSLLPWLRGILILGMLMFGVDLFVFLLAYRIRKYRTDPDPRGVIGELANLNQSELICQVTANIVGATYENYLINNSKARVIRRGLDFLGASIFLMVVFGVILVVALSMQ